VTSSLAGDPFDALPAEPAAAASWLVAALRGEADALADRAVEERVEATRRPASSWRRQIAYWTPRLGAFRAMGDARLVRDRVELPIETERGRRYTVRCRLTEDGARVRGFFLARELPPGATLRTATEADLATLVAIEQATGIARGDGSRVTTSRGERFFDWVRLQGDCRVVLVEVDGAPAACDAIAVRLAAYQGRPVRLFYRHHTRVLPGYRRLGLNEAMAGLLNLAALERPDVYGGYVYVDPQNTVIQEWSPTPAWRLRPFRALLDCRRLGGADAGRSAIPADATRIAALLNAAHGSEELYLAFDGPLLADRLSRTPERYGFAQLRLGTRAVVGCFDAGESVRVEDAAGAVVSARRRAHVLDYGFEGATGLDELEALLRAECARLAATGTTHLSLFSCDGAPAATRLRALADEVIEVEFQSWIAEPHDLPQRGLFVDPVYF
jgi:hypothetical protein